jgi:hypothetical protein
MCGAIACLWQALPNLTNWQLRNLIKMSSDRYTNPTNTHGYGIPNFCTAYQIALGTSDVIAMDYTFAVFPNPSQGEFYLKSYDASIQELSYSLYGLNGNLIYRTGMIKSPVIYSDALKNVASGEYILLVSTVNKQFSTKIVKQ